MSQPKAFLIQVRVTVNPDGSLSKPTITSYYDGAPTDPLKVNVGDHIAWLVQVVLPSTVRNPLPYKLDFSGNPGFFGTSSLNVPSGGPSPFLPVRAVQAKLKYTLIIPGLETIDPDIQSGGDIGPLGGLGRAATAYTVAWDTAYPANPMTYSVGGGAQQPFPLKVAVGDSVAFNAINAVAPANFSIIFAGLNWASPFSFDNGKFSATGTPTAIGPLIVGDTGDPDGKFIFTASITASGNPTPITSAPTQNEIDMKPAGADQRHRDSK